MKCGFLAIIAVFLCAATSASGGIIVRSGEHAGFSRLVFSANAEFTWVLKDHDEEYTLVIHDLKGEIDLTRVYRLIPKTRLLAISVLPDEPGSVLLHVAKDHHIKTFEIPPNILVLDVKVGPKPEIATGLPIAANLAPQHIQIDAPMMPAAPDDATAPLGFPRLAVIESQQRIEAQIDRATRQGLIVSSHQNAGRPSRIELVEPDKTDPVSQDAVGTPAANIYETEKTYQDHLNLTVQNVYDRELPSQYEKPVIASDGPICFDDRLFDLENWRPETTPSDAISNLRRNLIAEFDLPDKDTLQKLVKLYIVLGFSLEALELLKVYPDLLPHEALLKEMAVLVESGEMAENSVLSSQAQCPGKSGMWAILARSEIPLGEIPDRKSIAHHFSVLPANLRKQIGPRLGTRLLAARFTIEAETIAKLIARSPGKDNAEVSLFFAQLDLAGGRTKKAEKRLLALIESDAVNAPQAIDLLISHRLRNGDTVERNLINHAAGLALELRGSQAGQDLRRVEILSWAALNEQYRAFEILTHEAVLQYLDPHLSNQIANEVFLSFGSAFSDASEIVHAYFRYRYLLTNDPEMDNARRQVAQSLLAVGLPKPALEVLEPLQHRSLPMDDHLLGEILLILGEPKQARNILERSRGTAPNPVLVKTYEQLGEFDLALKLLEETSGASDDLAWKAGQWDLVSKSKITSRRLAAGFQSRAASSPENSDETHHGEPQSSPKTPTISALTNMLKTSTSERETLETLLQDHPEP